VHHGRVVKRTGDGAIVEFRSVVDAVRCAIEVQSGLAERNAGLPPEKRIEYRVGIHLGDVVEEADGDLMGDGSISPHSWEGSRSLEQFACRRMPRGGVRRGNRLECFRSAAAVRGYAVAGHSGPHGPCKRVSTTV
jgi:hypothetical protein